MSQCLQPGTYKCLLSLYLIYLLIIHHIKLSYYTEHGRFEWQVVASRLTCCQQPGFIPPDSAPHTLHVDSWIRWVLSGVGHSQDQPNTELHNASTHVP